MLLLYKEMICHKHIVNRNSYILNSLALQPFSMVPDHIHDRPRGGNG